jgi:hypothetical protein
MDVDHRQVRAAGREQLERVGRGGRHADLEFDAVAAVELQSLSGVDP